MATNNVSSTSSSGFTNTFRIGGLATGMDTDQLVQQLMSTEKLPLDKVKQNKQLAEWKRDAYREVTTLLKSFQSDFFDVLKPASNMMSQSIYQKYTATSSDSTVVTAYGRAGVTNLNHTIAVNKIAKAASGVSTASISNPLVGEAVNSFELNSLNRSFTLSYNGVSKTILLPEGAYADAAGIVGNGSDGLLKQKVKEAFDGINVVTNGTAIEFTSTNASDTIKVSSNPIMDNLLSQLKTNTAGEGSPITFPLSVMKGRKFSISIVEGNSSTTKEIEWTSDKTYNSSNVLAAEIQSMINGVLPAGKVTVSGSGGKLTFSKGSNVDSIRLSDMQYNTKVADYLGFDSGDSNKLSLSDTLEKVSSRLQNGNISFTNGNLLLTINGSNIELKSTDTLSTLISKVNNSSAGVTMSYSAFTDKFTLLSKQTGEGTIALNDHGSSFFTNIKLTNIEPGQNAEFKLDGLNGTRNSNTFSVDGVTYTLQKEDIGVEKSITLSQDADTVYESVKKFVDTYNDIISKLNGKLGEKYDRSYQPLTDDQKDAMSEDYVDKWESKAKTGLLRNDSILSAVSNSLRQAMYDNIDSISGGLYSIGISTGSFEQKGKLIIDETKLKEAIKNSPDQVMNIFSKQSATSYSPDLNAADKSKRYKESGIAIRISDILQDNIRTTRNSQGQKGILLAKAGMVGDASEYNNLIFDEIDKYDYKISSLTDKLIDKENQYYKRFAAMEKMISQMNSQSSWLTAQLGQSSR